MGLFPFSITVNYWQTALNVLKNFFLSAENWNYILITIFQEAAPSIKSEPDISEERDLYIDEQYDFEHEGECVSYAII